MPDCMLLLRINVHNFLETLMLFFLLLSLLLFYTNVPVLAMEDKSNISNEQVLASIECIVNDRQCEPELLRLQDFEAAFDLFHGFGIEAVCEFEFDDLKIEEYKRRKVQEFMKRNDETTFACKKAVHKQMCYFLKLLPCIYLNVYFNDFMRLIEGAYREVLNNSPKADEFNKFKQLQEEAQKRIEKIQVDRGAQKRSHLENKVLEILIRDRSELPSLTNTLDSSALYKRLTDWGVSFNSAQNSFQNELINMHAHEEFSHICFIYSYWSWLDNEDEHALEFGKKAQDVAAHLLERTPPMHNPYNYWVDMLAGKKQRERRTYHGTKILKKRHYPRVKTLFEKRQRLTQSEDDTVQ